MDVPVLSYLVFVPVAGSLFLLGFPRDREDETRWGALGCSLLEVLLAVLLLVTFRGGEASGDLQLTEATAWIPALGARYALGVDGLSLFLVVLAAFLTPLGILASWRAVRDRVREFHIALLLVEASTIGVFACQDLLLFYVFWELMLIPMALLVGIWGGERRIYAAVKFVLYTLAGSLPMLVAVLYCGLKAGTFSIPDLPDALRQAMAEGRLAPEAPVLCFGAFALAFAIKVPIFPLHTWLPDAHTEAPTAGSVMLAGVLLKMGAYGFLRIAMPFFPGALDANLVGGLTYLSLFRTLGVIGIVYGALMAMAQTDMKKLVAYSSVSHLGYVVVGLFSLTVKGVEGAVLQMVNHGLSTGALFLLVGMLYERTHTRSLLEHGGVASVAPRYALVMVLTALASIGLPGLNGFPGEFLVLMGTYEISPALAATAGLGLILGAVYTLGMVRQVLFGKPADPKRPPPPDLDRRECWIFVPLVASFFLLGLWPRLVVDRMDAAASRGAASVRPPAAASGASTPGAVPASPDREY